MMDPKDLPSELQHLIEKRNSEKDRRQSGPVDGRKPEEQANGSQPEDRRKSIRRHSD
ncbi:MAG: hypothetical protein AAF456_13590 [Planctomycetota bacterium]